MPHHMEYSPRRRTLDPRDFTNNLLSVVHMEGMEKKQVFQSQHKGLRTPNLPTRENARSNERVEEDGDVEFGRQQGLRPDSICPHFSSPPPDEAFEIGAEYSISGEVESNVSHSGQPPESASSKADSDHSAHTHPMTAEKTGRRKHKGANEIQMQQIVLEEFNRKLRHHLEGLSTDAWSRKKKMRKAREFHDLAEADLRKLRAYRLPPYTDTQWHNRGGFFIDLPLAYYTHIEPKLKMNRYDLRRRCKEEWTVITVYLDNSALDCKGRLALRRREFEEKEVKSGRTPTSFWRKKGGSLEVQKVLV